MSKHLTIQKAEDLWKVIDSDGRFSTPQQAKMNPKGSWVCSRLSKSIKWYWPAKRRSELPAHPQDHRRNKSCWEVIDILYRTFSSG